MGRILYTGSGIGDWALFKALNHPGHEYVCLDINSYPWRIDGPESAQRYIAGIAVLDVRDKIGIGPDDPVYEPLTYLGNDYLSESCIDQNHWF